MHAKKGFMLLEALLSLVIFSLIVSLFFFFVSIEKPSIFSPNSRQKFQTSSSQTYQIQSGEVKLEAIIGEWDLKNERYLFIQEVL